MQVNHKRIFRVYRELGLTVRRRKRKRLERVGAPRVPLTAANQEWALDFVHDATASGRAIRVLSVVDACTRECLALETDTSFASRRVTRVLEEIVAERGRPLAIRCDNGPELTSRHFLAWCLERKIALVHIQPGRAAAERAGGKFSRTVARRVFACELVCELVGRAAENHRVAGRVQPAAAAQQLGLSDADGLCAATRSVRRLRPGSRDYAARRCPTRNGLTACEFRMIDPADSGGRPAGGVQRGTAAQQFGVSDAGSVCGESARNAEWWKRRPPKPRAWKSRRRRGIREARGQISRSSRVKPSH